MPLFCFWGRECVLAACHDQHSSSSAESAIHFGATADGVFWIAPSALGRSWPPSSANGGQDAHRPHSQDGFTTDCLRIRREDGEYKRGFCIDAGQFAAGKKRDCSLLFRADRAQ